MQKGFEILDHTADVGIIAYGADMSQAFANAARALFSLITELDNVEEVICRDIELTAQDEESLLVEWLNELIYLFDTENLLFKIFEIAQLSEIYLKATCHGEKADSSRHTIKMGIKAATYHTLKIEKNDGMKVQVLFDV